MEDRLRSDMARKLDDALESVIDERSFVDFLSQLSVDWHTEREIEVAAPSSPYSSGALGWENGSIGTFLDASCDWARASEHGLPLYSPPENPWRRAADILMMGKLYE